MLVFFIFILLVILILYPFSQLGFLLLSPNTMSKSNLGKKGFISVYSSTLEFNIRVMTKTQIRNLEVEREAMVGYCLLTCFPQLM